MIEPIHSLATSPAASPAASLYTPTPIPPARLTPPQWAPARPLPTAETVRHYQLVVLMLPSAGAPGGEKRPILGLRWHLPLYEQLLRHPELGQRQGRLARPFVLRAALGEVIVTQITNLLVHTPLCMALVDDDYGILEGDGGEIAPGETQTCTWRCRHAGIYPIYNRACADAVERRTLLGVLMIEPA